MSTAAPNATAAPKEQLSTSPALVPAPTVAALPKRQIMRSNFGLQVGGYKHNRWWANLDENQALDDVTEPKFWIHVVDGIMGHDKSNPRGRGDIIEVRKADTGLYAEFLIVEIGTGFVKVIPVRAAEPQAVDVPGNCPLATRWNVGAKTHDVVRRADNAVMRGGFQTKAGAAAWIAEHLKAMAA